MAPGGWDRIAAWRDDRTGETGDLWHRALIDPGLLSVVGAVRGLRVLEIACGNGYLTRRFARDGARRAVGIDRSGPSIERAVRRERRVPTGARFARADASDLRRFRGRSFDLVVANMALMDIEDAAGAVREARRVLARDGRFVFSICHPCFDTDERSMWVVERAMRPNGSFGDTVWRKVSGYRDERKSSVPWFVSPTRTAWTTAYHRTLSTYSRLLRDAGFAIRRMEEPTPGPELLEQSPQGRYIAEIPLHLIVEAVPDAVRRAASGTTARTRRGAGRRSGSPGRRRRTGSGRRGSIPGS